MALQAAHSTRSPTSPTATPNAKTHSILAHEPPFRCLRGALVDAPAGARCAALGAIIELAWGAAQLRAAGIESTLRHLVEFGVGPSSGAGIGGAGVDKEIRERARRALEAMERAVAVPEEA